MSNPVIINQLSSTYSGPKECEYPWCDGEPSEYLLFTPKMQVRVCYNHIQLGYKLLTFSIPIDEVWKKDTIQHMISAKILYILEQMDNPEEYPE